MFDSCGGARESFLVVPESSEVEKLENPAYQPSGDSFMHKQSFPVDVEGTSLHQFFLRNISCFINFFDFPNKNRRILQFLTFWGEKFTARLIFRLN
jgi:hypothetical protein